MNQYFVENASTKYFEEVDEYIYENFRYVVNEVGSDRATGCRYSGKRFASINGEVVIGFTPSKVEMGVICRMLGVTIPQGTFAPTAKSLPVVNLLVLKKGNSILHYNPVTGDEFKLTNNRRKKLAA
jgi:hypothetical protein